MYHAQHRKTGLTSDAREDVFVISLREKKWRHPEFRPAFEAPPHCRTRKIYERSTSPRSNSFVCPAIVLAEKCHFQKNNKLHNAIGILK